MLRRFPGGSAEAKHGSPPVLMAHQPAGAGVLYTIKRHPGWLIG